MRHKRKIEEVEFDIQTLSDLKKSLSTPHKILPSMGEAKIKSMGIEIEYIVDLCTDISILYVSEMCYAPGGLYMRFMDSDVLHLCDEGEVSKCMDTKTNEVMYHLGIGVELPGFEAQNLPIFIAVGDNGLVLGKIFAQDYLIKP
jgi:hypothetical protein